ncbi:L,D-transpeptidase [Salaquimonas pukyongi]|uniref:L,D-transpeptidase n=1 Tax=Salaquimonas pukyongi TaxID=2712698 RepID=UPI00096B9EF2|nr:L,D-transpeptidase [Salaquimonas pukyongi]
MRKMFLAASAGVVISLTLSLSAGAQSRYSPPPATVLSGDLASPWLLQLTNRDQYRKVTRRNAAALQLLNKQRKKKRLKRTAMQQDSQQVIQPVSRSQPQAAPQMAALPKKPDDGLDPKYLPQRVAYSGSEKPGTIVIDTSRRYLYLVEDNGQATRYGVGVGREGFSWTGTEKITRKAEWPQWRPPEEMRIRERKKGRELPVVMEGGPANPLGARALYLGSTLYRIHGTNQPWTIGGAVSSGCIRMRNEDVTDLYARVGVGTKVVVR